MRDEKRAGHALVTLCVADLDRTVAAIAAALFISPKVVKIHVANIFDKLGLARSDSDNRRVIAAITYLES